LHRQRSLFRLADQGDHRNPVAEHVEASLTGDIALGLDSKPSLHVHCVLGRRDGSASPAI
jgi:predicted DNA-binding protein with PD1-like motif